ncbi:hypothetical protein Tco_1545863 [Tanacetum coccineum]
MADLLLKEKLSQALQALCEKLNKNVQEKQEEKNVAKEQAAKVSSQYWKPPIYYDDDDDDEESSIPLKDIIFELPLSIAITRDFLITDSLIMEDENLDTIPETKSDKENESSVEDLNLTPTESEDLSDIESECDMPVCDDFTNFSNPIFDSNDDLTSSDDESLFDEDVQKENFKVYSNPLFDEEIISTKIDPHHFNAESDLIESLLNRDTSIVSSPKFDSLLEEISSELAHIDLISLEIDETDFDPKEEIRLVEKFLYDNSSPRHPKKLNSENSDAVIESFSPSPIPVEDKGDILEELLNNDSFSLPENESFHPSSPPAKPSDDDGIHFEIESDMGVLTAKVVDDISEHYVLMPSILPTHPNHCPVIDKSPHSLSHRGFKAFQIIYDFSKSPMMTVERTFLSWMFPFSIVKPP